MASWDHGIEGREASWQCGNMAMWQCANVAMCQCGNVSISRLRLRAPQDARTQTPPEDTDRPSSAA